MRPLRDGIARPLLAIGRAETSAMCKAAKIRPREDPSNKSLRFARNRVRLRVLPELERLNPKIRNALARFADAAAETEPNVPSPDATERDGVALDVRALPADLALRERALSDAWVAAGGITLAARHRAALLKLASSTDGSRRIDLPGGQAVREYERLIFRGPAIGTATAAPDSAANATAPVALIRGGQVIWHGWRITLDVPTDGAPHTGAVDVASAARLGVRARRPGDRIAASGKLQDVFVDAKVPARARDTWPLVTLDDAVIWVPGVTTPPHTGTVAIAAAPVREGPAAGEYEPASYLPIRQVASKAVPRPRGGNRGRA
jgi:tRNA(Ile)-lysidine synthase